MADDCTLMQLLRHNLGQTVRLVKRSVDILNSGLESDAEKEAELLRLLTGKDSVATTIYKMTATQKVMHADMMNLMRLEIEERAKEQQRKREMKEKAADVGRELTVEEWEMLEQGVRRWREKREAGGVETGEQ